MATHKLFLSHTFDIWDEQNDQCYYLTLQNKKN